MYIKKIDFENSDIVSLVKEAVNNKFLRIPEERPYLQSRANIKKEQGTFESIMEENKIIEIRRRIDRATQLHGKKVNSFNQYLLTTETENLIISKLPDQLITHHPKIAVQIIRGGQSCTPHKDHSKKSSMFYLLTEPDVITKWWEKSEPFEEFNDLRYGDPDKLKLAHSEIIEQGKWYLFNNDEYHSIHAIENRIIHRTCILIEFDISIVDLYKLICND